MPDDMTALVEAFRVKRGHKATAIAVRELISTGLEVAGHLIGPIYVAPPKPIDPFELVAAIDAEVHAETLVQFGPSEFKSRLKPDKGSKK